MPDAKQSTHGRFEISTPRTADGSSVDRLRSKVEAARAAEIGETSEEEEPMALATLPLDIVNIIGQLLCPPSPLDVGACHLASCCHALRKVLRPTTVDHVKELRRVHQWCKKQVRKIDLLADNSSRDICNWQNLREPDGGAMASVITWGLCSKTWNLLMSSTRLGDAGCAKLAPAFAVMGAMPALHSLSLASMGIGDAGVLVLTDAWNAGALRHLFFLDFAENPFGDKGSLALVKCFCSGGLDGLNDLHLTNPRFTDVFGDAMAAALADGALPKLRRLIMRYFRDVTASAETSARLASACRDRKIMLIDCM